MVFFPFRFCLIVFPLLPSGASSFLFVFLFPARGGFSVYTSPKCGKGFSGFFSLSIGPFVVLRYFPLPSTKVRLNGRETSLFFTIFSWTFCFDPPQKYSASTPSGRVYYSPSLPPQLPRSAHENALPLSSLPFLLFFSF